MAYSHLWSGMWERSKMAPVLTVNSLRHPFWLH